MTTDTSSQPPTPCESCQLALSESFDDPGTVLPQEAATHLADCPDCRQFQKLWNPEDHPGNLSGLAARPIPPSQKPRPLTSVIARLESTDQETTLPSTHRPSSKIIVWIASAAALIVLLLALNFSKNQTPSDPVTDNQPSTDQAPVQVLLSEEKLSKEDIRLAYQKATQKATTYSTALLASAKEDLTNLPANLARLRLPL